LVLDTPEFTHLSDAEQFLAKVAALVAHGQLDFQAGQNLSNLAPAWITAQYQREELQIKQINSGTSEHEQVIRITGGLPPLPGANVTMPVLDHGPVTNGHALEPPVPQIESSANDSVPSSNDSIPSNPSANGNDGGPA
jgi:hypothetical protein